MAHDITKYKPNTNGNRTWDWGDSSHQNLKELSLAEQASAPASVAGQMQIYTTASNDLQIIDGDGNTDSIALTSQLPAGLTVVYKTATEAVDNGSTGSTLHNDLHLFTSVTAGKKYRFRFVLFVTTQSGNPDFKVAVTTPAGNRIYTVIGAADGPVANMEFKGTSISSGTSYACLFSAAVTRVPVIIEGTVAPSSDGTLQLQWAQNTSHADDTSINSGSYLEIAEV